MSANVHVVPGPDGRIACISCALLDGRLSVANNSSSDNSSSSEIGDTNLQEDHIGFHLWLSRSIVAHDGDGPRFRVVSRDPSGSAPVPWSLGFPCLSDLTDGW